MISGPLISRFGYPLTATLYCVIALTFIGLIAVRWHAHLRQRDAPTNKR